MSIEILNHTSYSGCYGEPYLEFSVRSNGIVVINLHEAFEDFQNSETDYGIHYEVVKVNTIPYTPEQPMQLPTGGWLAVHSDGGMRCHKHRRNARKWMERPHSDFMLCK